MVTALLSHPAFLAHEVPEGHPECARRLMVINDQLHETGIYDLLVHHEAAAATRQQLERVHSAGLIDALEALSPGSGFAAVDADTYMGAHTLEAAHHAAGAAVAATDLVLEGQADNAFCAVRPPGHHAERDRAMGFCFFNNVAVGAAHALHTHGLERVAVIDFDVHHGNGTEDIFAGDPRVLFCSTFQHPHYPLKGADTEASNVFNVPLPAGTGSDAYRAAVTKHWVPALEEFGPEMIFVSAGFDGHVEDPMSAMSLVDDDYRWISALIMDAGRQYAGGRIVSCLEGGYALDALGRCVGAHIRTLAGVPDSTGPAWP